MPTPDRRPRGHNRRAQQRRQDESQGTLLHRINAATLPLRQRLGQGLGGLGQRNKEPKAASFKLASPLPRKHTIGLLILIPLSLVLLLAAIWAFAWAVRRGQFDDLDTPALDILGLLLDNLAGTVWPPIPLPASTTTLRGRMPLRSTKLSSME